MRNDDAIDEVPTREARLRVRRLSRADREEVAALLGRGMSDNPMQIAVHGGDDRTRARRHARLMRDFLAASSSLRLEGMELGGALVGVAASAPPGHCRPAVGARLRLIGTASTFGPAAAARVVRWNRAWTRRDPDEPHVHLGPVSVDRHLRGRGIGGLLLLRHVAYLDTMGAVGYLETDRPEAVGFYRRFGYGVVGTAEILGVRCWFMRRPSV